jgi:hypothetical protein
VKLIAALVLATVATRIAFGPFTADDAFITFRYSENIVNGLGFVYNVGERVLGTSTPLFTLLLSAASLVTSRLDWAALAISSIADVVTVLCMMSIVQRGVGPTAAVLSAILFIFWPQTVANSVSGMETPLYNALILLAFWWATRERPIALGLTLAALLLCRPDGAAAAGIAGMLALSVNWKKGLASGAIGLGLFAPWVVFAWRTFGTPIPNSLAAKAASHQGYDRWLSLQNFADYFGSGPHALLSALAVAGAGWVFLRGTRTLRVWLVWWVVYAAAFILNNAFTHYRWYFVPLLPFYFVAVAVAVDRGFVWIDGLLQQRSPRSWVGIQGVLFVVCALVLMQRVMAQKEYQRQISSGREALYQVTAKELAARDPRCTVAATEIGAIGYSYPGRILDLVGLVSPEAIGKPQAQVTVQSDARWLVTYDTHFEPSPEFSSVFQKLSATRVTADRNLIVYERTGGGPCTGPIRK